MTLTFDPIKHEYKASGHRVPSVTQLLGKLHSFAGIPEEILKAACERGTAVHQACEYWDQCDLDEGTLDPRTVPYLDAWKRFTDDMRPKWIEIEKVGYHPLGFAGAWDRGGLIDCEDWTIDIKTALQPHPVWSIQLAAYNALRQKMSAKRATVQLRKDGTYKFIVWDDSNAWPTFCSLLTLHNWGIANGGGKS